MEGKTKVTTEILLKKGLLQSEELYQYVLETSVYPREPESLREIRAATAGHPWAFMSTGPDAGQLMAMFLKTIDARKTIEIGVFTGYSLLLTALTIPEDGKIIAIDPDEEAYNIGLPIIKNAGVQHKINFVKSEGLQVLDELLENHNNEGSFDFAFVDADKDNYAKYHEKLMKLVRIGGIIMYDNTLFLGTVAMPEESLPEPFRVVRNDMIEFNKLLTADTRLQICQAPSADGVTICRRLH